MKINKDNIYWKISEDRQILDGHPILKNHPIYRYSDTIPVYRKKPTEKRGQWEEGDA